MYHWSFNYIEGYLVGVYSYPDQQPSIKIEFLANTLRRGAEETDAPEELLDALRNDVEFVKAASSLVCAFVFIVWLQLLMHSSLTYALRSSVAHSRRLLTARLSLCTILRQAIRTLSRALRHG